MAPEERFNPNVAGRAFEGGSTEPVDAGETPGTLIDR
jgi:hypothetical protein